MKIYFITMENKIYKYPYHTLSFFYMRLKKKKGNY